MAYHEPDQSHYYQQPSYQEHDADCPYPLAENASSQLWKVSLLADGAERPSVSLLARHRRRSGIRTAVVDANVHAGTVA